MPFVSHAQNWEDVMLWRALGHIARGAYLDVGAFDPVVDSVSLGFYDRGWRGRHVEPVAVYAERLRVARPDETVIEAALGAAAGHAELFVVNDTGMSSLCADWATRAEASGYAVHRTIVDVRTLDQVLADWPGELHWLKIDVEGAEAQVLSGWAATDPLPWIVVIESVAPGGQQQLHAEWEGQLVKKGYKFVFFDGLNRYYLSPRHLELEIHFRFGPSVWDDFRLGPDSRLCYSLVKSAAEEIELLSRRCQALEEKIRSCVTQASEEGKSVE